LSALNRWSASLIVSVSLLGADFEPCRPAPAADDEDLHDAQADEIEK
jgi:hypothetical protein